MQKFFKRAFNVPRCSSYIRLMVDENSIDVNGDSLEILMKIFLTLVGRFTLFISSLNYEII